MLRINSSTSNQQRNYKYSLATILCL